MDYMPHREDEMVVDEETFVNASASTDASASSTSPWSYPASSAAASTPGFDLTQFHTHKHAGCLHPLNLDEFPGVALQIWEAPASALHPVDQPTLFVIHPRWCGYCVSLRTEQINSSMETQYRKIGESRQSIELKEQSQAYLEGKARGRIEAMSMPLEECERMCSPVEDGMLKMLKGLELEGQKDEVDELAKLMGDVGMEYDELSHEILQYFRAEDAEKQGYLDGMGGQARVERQAFNAPTLELKEDWLRREWHGF